MSVLPHPKKNVSACENHTETYECYVHPCHTVVFHPSRSNVLPTI